jgi:hypothetical protein
MINIGKGIIAGLIASGAAFGVVAAAAAFGFIADTDPVRAMSGIVLAPVGLSWVLHFAIGTMLWGVLFAILAPALPGPFLFKGVVFGAALWLLTTFVMWALDPVVAPNLGVQPIVVHGLFGAVLGLAYSALLDASERHSSSRAGNSLGRR